MDYPLVFNDLRQYVLISHLSVQLCPTMKVDGRVITPQRHICAHGHTDVYVWSNVPYMPTITLIIKGAEVKKDVVQYPDYSDKLIAAILVFREEKVIRQWIDFHIGLGIDHFIVYDNAPVDETTTKDLLADYISSGRVLYLKWALPAESLKSQQLQQNHAIYTWRKAAYIGLFDVDEFMNPLGPEKSLRKILDSLVGQNRDRLGGVQLGSRIFENPDGLPIDGYDFLKTPYATENIVNHRQKLFVIPPNVNIFSVHVIVNGKQPIRVDPEFLRFHHYWFLSSLRGGGRERMKTILRDTTILQHLPKV